MASSLDARAFNAFAARTRPKRPETNPADPEPRGPLGPINRSPPDNPVCHPELSCGRSSNFEPCPAGIRPRDERPSACVGPFVRLWHTTAPNGTCTALRIDVRGTWNEEPFDSLASLVRSGHSTRDDLASHERAPQARVEWLRRVDLNHHDRINSPAGYRYLTPQFGKGASSIFGLKARDTTQSAARSKRNLNLWRPALAIAAALRACRRAATDLA